MNDTYLVWCIQGYDYYKKEVETYFKVVDLEIIAKDYKEALQKAKILVDKKNFRLKLIIEKYRNGNT